MPHRNQIIESTVTTRTAQLIAGALAVVGLGLMALSVQPWATGPWGALLGQLGGLLLATGLLTVLWDLYGRRAFAMEVLAKAKLSADVVESGITRVTDQYLDDVEWGELFHGANHVDIVVAYANTWRNIHLQRLEQVASTPGSLIRVFLPDPNDAATVANLAQRTAEPAEKVAGRINEAITAYTSLRERAAGTVEVYVRSGDPLFSAYRFDGRAVVTMYSHRREGRTPVPAFVLAGGKLFGFVRGEIDAIHAQSTML